MRQIGIIELPEHKGPGGFDHAALHQMAGRLYVAHTSNDALDVIDCVQARYLHSIPDLTGVAGALISEELGLILTSNRGEDTVGIIDPHHYEDVVKVKVGVRPNGLSIDAKRGLLLAANVGNPDVPNSFTLSIVDVFHREMIHSIPVRGRTRWTIFDENSGCFYTNIADPAEIVVVNSAKPSVVARVIPVPAQGPHGLDLDGATGRLFCACDAGTLLVLDAQAGIVLLSAQLSGTPDVIFFNAARTHLYVAVGDPGVVDVFEADTLQRLETIPTSRGAHTIGFDALANKVYVFEPLMHRAVVYEDETH
jgi:DNA-binding beta-propeller fold protein YncE